MEIIRHKKPTAQAKETKRFIAAYSIVLMDEVKRRIVRDWRRGVSIVYLAKDYKISQRSAEAVVWESIYPDNPPVVTLSSKNNLLVIERRREVREEVKVIETEERKSA